jgi:hypothetical protein
MAAAAMMTPDSWARGADVAQLGHRKAWRIFYPKVVTDGLAAHIKRRPVHRCWPPSAVKLLSVEWIDEHHVRQRAPAGTSRSPAI